MSCHIRNQGIAEVQIGLIQGSLPAAFPPPTIHERLVPHETVVTHETTREVRIITLSRYFPLYITLAVLTGIGITLLATKL